MRIAVFVRKSIKEEIKESSYFDIEAAEKVAIAEASRIIKLRGGDVEIFAIGDKQFANVLSQLYGATRVVILNDDMFKDLDVYSKADLFILALRKSKPFDVLMFGEYVQDDPDWQLPYLVADKLNWPHITRAIRAWNEDSRIVCECIYYDSLYLKESRIPVVVSMLDVNFQSVTPIKDFKPKEVVFWDSKFLGIKELNRKIKINEIKKEFQKNPKMIDYNSYDELANKIVEIITKK